ncbi:hypothetical protein K469DRAFT_626674 [Zopfia rhizophila CBS 207.26]|uniref:Nucleolar 27S pre-rRNA processing Urb2/Npa2 C-terminal domain-containing protein n=1 Tax=Zopfia rhizophila CBS 207.26 TaxID=1314779 RepID=A0A6A6ECL4_9PEZI|nr:hypothetical protein K469DRAFT_626674 [Zopfia rhizophila CBS 207.26]
MASLILPTPPTPAPSLPKLLAINKNSGELNEQIRQATHIIGLPNDWDKMQDDSLRPMAPTHLVRARAEWVLRWILDKLKEQDDVGVHARTNAKAWKLLEWMLRVTPVSRAAIHLRDASFLTILEGALRENFENDIMEVSSVLAAEHRNEISESSETAQEEPTHSRKRKRPSSGTSTPSKKVALERSALDHLFKAIVEAVKVITSRISSDLNGENAILAEHMKMVLRTESAQAARILKFWLMAVHKVLSAASKSSLPSFDTLDDYLSLRPVLEVWDLRAVAVSDNSGASAEEFSTECLIPALMLHDAIQDTSNSMYSEQNNPDVRNRVAQSLERLLVRHLFAPSRAAFFTDLASSHQPEGRKVFAEAKFFATCLDPLRAKIEQAAEIYDAAESIPITFKPLFRVIPRLLEMTIRFSPSRSPKSRLAEKPWIQAVFVALAECAGCALRAAEFAVPNLSLDALQESLAVLASRGITIDSKILEDVFWFHTGAKFPLNKKRLVQWPLVAALIESDPDLFLPKPRSNSSAPDGRPENLSQYLFDLISSIPVYDLESVDISREDDARLTGQHELARLLTRNPHGTYDNIREAFQHSIIIPIMSAFARSRDLLGFLSLWDAQLLENATIIRRALKGSSESTEASLWEAHDLNLALAQLLEQSLTQSQILNLFKQHEDRITSLRKALERKPSEELTSKKLLKSFKSACSSSIVLNSLLDSIHSDETVECLKPHFKSFLATYASLVQLEPYRSASDLALSWTIISQLWIVLWPIEIHGSLNTQKTYLESGLIDRAYKDIAVTLKDADQDNTSSTSRVAALTFLLTVCLRLRTVPGWEESTRIYMKRVVDSLSPAYLEPADLRMGIEMLSSRFSILLEYLEPSSRMTALYDLLLKISKIEDKDLKDQMVGSFADSTLTATTSSVKSDFWAALLAAMTEQSSMKGHLRSAAEQSYLEAPVAVLSRHQREATLDKITDILISQPRDVNALLSIMIRLMQVPNSTAKVSVDGSIFFDIAQNLHDGKFDSESTIQLFKELVYLTLDHISKDKDQPRNQNYLEKFKSKVASAIKKPRRCVPLKLAIIRAAALVQKETFISWDLYLEVLNACLTTSEPSVPVDAFLDALNDIPFEILQGRKDLFSSEQTVLRGWLDSKNNWDDVLNSEDDASLSPFSTQTWLRIHKAMAVFAVYPDKEIFLRLSLRILRENVSTNEHRAITESVQKAMLLLDTTQKLNLVLLLTQYDNGKDRVEPLRLLHALINTLENDQIDDPAQKQQLLVVLPTICNILAGSSDTATFNTLLDTIDTILRDKPSLTSQHNIECILTVLVKLLSPSSPALPTTYAPAIYSRLCETTRLILLLHRGRLGGRFHLLLPLLQNLLACLFIPNQGRGSNLPKWLSPSLSSSSSKLTPTNASEYTKLLTTLCSPTVSSLTRNQPFRRENGLKDPVKAARTYASQHITPLLSTFCRCMLNGRLQPEVREKVMPGMWEVLTVAGMDMEGLRAMDAGLDKGTKEVWRGVWGEWRGRGGRGEGMGGL